jgi:hypothetical protein
MRLTFLRFVDSFAGLLTLLAASTAIIIAAMLVGMRLVG